LNNWRILPTGLAISRSFGDKRSKIDEDGTRNNLILNEPDIFSINQKNLDFVIVVSGGITNHLCNKKIISTIWETIEVNKNSHSASLVDIN
jgi:serine/threonine protein phosphatase PrpC